MSDQPQPYSAATAIGYGWDKFKGNAWPFVGIAVLTLLVGGALNGAGNAASRGGDEIDSAAAVGLALVGGVVGLVFSILAQIAYTLLTAAMIRGALDATEGRQVTFSSMFERWDKLQVLVAALVIGVLTVVGLVLCILPGIVVIFLTWFTSYFIVGNGLEAIAALKSSVRFTGDHIGELLVFALLCIACVIAGALACFVGLLVAIPVVTIASAYTFRTLQGQPAAS